MSDPSPKNPAIVDPETVEAEWVVTDLPSPPGSKSGPQAPPGGTFFLVNLADGHGHPLRLGVNTIGREGSNDLVLQDLGISRRHCTVTTDAKGGCEVKDAGSLNGIQVNYRRVDQAKLAPGDVLSVFQLRFLVTWMGPNGDQLPAGTVRILQSVVPRDKGG